MTGVLKLGLIGDNIAQSRSPDLHETCGRLAGIETRYERLVPRALGLSFEQVFAKAKADGLRGVNVTYPYKERAFALLDTCDGDIQAIGAVNTVLFDEGTTLGFNTDYSGFIHAYRAARIAKPDTVCLIGAGGVGKAVAFALLALNARAIICVDLDTARAQALADALSATGTQAKITVSDDAVASAQGANGIINCTPMGMSGIGGSPLPDYAMQQADWAFDAVYTPVNTPFLQGARHHGLTVITGYELFLAQGCDAWGLFSDQTIDPEALRVLLTGDAA